MSGFFCLTNAAKGLEPCAKQCAECLAGCPPHPPVVPFTHDEAVKMVGAMVADGWLSRFGPAPVLDAKRLLAYLESAAALSQAGEPGRERLELDSADASAMRQMVRKWNRSDLSDHNWQRCAQAMVNVLRMFGMSDGLEAASSGATREGATDSILNRRVMGYRARVEFVASRRVLFGTLDGIRDVVTFESATVEGMEDAMRASILDYLSQCREAGEPPNPPPPHEHCCMRCGGTFECPMGEECEAGRDVMPNLIRRDAHGNVVVVEHCPMPATHPGASHV